MAALSTMIQTTRPAPFVRSAPRPARRSVLAAAGGTRQDKKAEYVKKQDEKEAVNPGGSAGGGQTRDKKDPTGAYGATGKKGDGSDDGQIQKSEHMEDAKHN